MLSKPSKLSLGLKPRFLMASAMLGSLGLTGCGTVAPTPRILVPDTFRQACASPAPDAVKTLGDLAAHSIRQEAALQVCDASRAGLVALIDAAAPKPRTWWPIRLPGS